MNEKFTPGPWEADSTHTRTAINSIATANSQRKHIAMVNLAKNPDYEIWGKEHNANANLIAAAPDMYETLKALEWCCGDEESPWCPCCKEYAPDHAKGCNLLLTLKKARGK